MGRYGGLGAPGERPEPHPDGRGIATLAQIEQNALNAPGEDSYSLMSSRPDKSLYDVVGTRTFAENAVPLARRQSSQ